MFDVEQLVELLAAKYRWGLHPFKLFVALLAPVLVVWFADRRLRTRNESSANEEPGITLPPTRRQ